MLDHREFLVYLAGYVYGDGNLYYDKKKGCYVIRLYDRSYEYLHGISRVVRELLNVKLSIYKRRGENLYVGKIYSKRLYLDLSELINSALAGKIERRFIQGLLDAEGCVYMRKRGGNIDVEVNLANKNIYLLDKVVKYLADMGVKAKLVVRSFQNPTRTIGYMRIYGFRNGCLTLKNLKPLHPRFKPLYELCSLPSPERELGKLAP